MNPELSGFETRPTPNANVLELVDNSDLESEAARRVGSSPSIRTTSRRLMDRRSGYEPEGGSSTLSGKT